MGNWSRAKDAWIARECEGLDVWVNAGDGAICEYQDASIPHYSTDPAACIRAAEAWRKKGEGRTVKIEWDGPDVKAGLGDRVGGWHQWFSPSDRCATALAWALYRATGGPA